MSIFDALLRGRSVYRRLFAAEENQDETAGSFSPPDISAGLSVLQANPRTDAAPADFARNAGSYRLSASPGLPPALAEDAPARFSLSTPSQAAPDPDSQLETLIRRMENDSRMYPQDFREE